MRSFRKSKKVRVPEWDSEPVLLQELSLGDVGPLMEKQADRVEFALEFVGRCLVNDDGKAVGAEWLRENVGASRLTGLMTLLEHCQELNGFGSEKTDKKEKTESPLAGAPAADEAGAGARKNGRRTGNTPDAAGVA